MITLEEKRGSLGMKPLFSCFSGFRVSYFLGSSVYLGTGVGLIWAFLCWFFFFSSLLALSRSGL